MQICCCFVVHAVSAVVTAYGPVLIAAAAFIGAAIAATFRGVPLWGPSVQCVARLAASSQREASSTQQATIRHGPSYAYEQMALNGFVSLSVPMNEVSTLGPCLMPKSLSVSRTVDNHHGSLQSFMDIQNGHDILRWLNPSSFMKRHDDAAMCEAVLVE